MIIGAHRSGTTATAHALRLLGLEIGEHLDSHEEPRGLQRLHEQYLQQRGAAWHNPTAFLEWMQTAEGQKHCTAYLRERVRRKFASIFGYRFNFRGLWCLSRLKLGKPWGWKEPRTTLFAPAWIELFPEARIVHVIRHPVAAALSIRQRELQFRNAGDPPTGRLDDLDYCLRLATKYIEQGESLASHTPNYQRVRFEDMQADPTRILAGLADFCGLQVTPAQMSKAAASIRPRNSLKWQELSASISQTLVSDHPIVAKLGYEWNAP